MPARVLVPKMGCLMKTTKRTKNGRTVCGPVMTTPEANGVVVVSVKKEEEAQAQVQAQPDAPLSSAPAGDRPSTQQASNSPNPAGKRRQPQQQNAGKRRKGAAPQRGSSASTATEEEDETEAAAAAAAPKAPAKRGTTTKRQGGSTGRKQPRTDSASASDEQQQQEQDATEHDDAQERPQPRARNGPPPNGMCALLTTSLAFTLKQVSEFCRVCCINVVPIHLDRTNGLSIAFGDATARMTVRITLPPAFFDAFQIREDEVVLGVEAGEFANICRRIKRRDSAAVYVDDRRENFSVAVRFGDRHINALDTKVSPTQVVLHELPLEQFAQAGVQPLCATMGTLHRAIKNMRTRTDRVHVRGCVSRWVEFSYTNETNTKSRDCFYAKGCSNSDLSEPVDYSFNVLVAHLSRALRMILLGPVSHLYLGPNLPLRISTPVPDSCGGCAEFVLAASP